MRVLDILVINVNIQEVKGKYQDLKRHKKANFGKINNILVDQ